MIKSMTGFVHREGKILALGRVSLELRTLNHKFFETVFHFPAGFLSLEEKIKKEIARKIKRGRVTCVVDILGGIPSRVFINKALLDGYISALKQMRKLLKINEELSLDTLIHLPGVLSVLEETRISQGKIWPHLKILLAQALDDLVRARQKEGRALGIYLKNCAEDVRANLGMIKTRFNKVVKDKLSQISNDEERLAFLKNIDISEELERLKFHIRNFSDKLAKNTPVGKELDFIAQEMQREANTISAKSCDTLISSRIVNVKSQIEKIREQVQNIE